MTSSKRSIALVGDYSPEILAHRAIPEALALAGADVTWSWISSGDIRNASADLAGFAAIWLVPGSPYINMQGTLDAARFARKTQRPFLGTCGGFQHCLIDFARELPGLGDADHAETSPQSKHLVITALSCSLVEKSGEISLIPGSQLHAIYGVETIVEGYHCNYGLNPEWRPALENAGLRFSAFDTSGDVRALEFRLKPTLLKLRSQGRITPRRRDATASDSLVHRQRVPNALSTLRDARQGFRR